MSCWTGNDPAPRIKLKFRVEPADSLVFVDGKRLGSGAIAAEVELPEGSAQLDVVNPCFNKFTLTLSEATRPPNVVRLSPSEEAGCVRKVQSRRNGRRPEAAAGTSPKPQAEVKSKPNEDDSKPPKKPPTSGDDDGSFGSGSDNIDPWKTD